MPVFVCMTGIFVLSAQPDLPTPPVFGESDKVQHFAIYIGLALLAYRGALLVPIRGSVGPYWQSICITALYGLSDELHQRFVPGRSADVADWLADVAGGLIAVLAVALVRKILANGRG
jgi:VanZ family protein